MSEVVRWPIETELPSDAGNYGLQAAIITIESYCGSVEAYERLCRAAEALKIKIETENAESRSCSRLKRSENPVAFGKSRHDLFWEKVDKSGDCWIWTAGTDSHGYGRFSVGNRKTDGAHRWAYMEANGPIPNGLLICHRCDNPPCVRPEHLFLGTYSDNMRDCSRKKRVVAPLREGSGKSKLTDEQVREIRSLYCSGKGTVQISKLYPISANQVNNIVSGKHRPSTGDNDPIYKIRDVRRLITHNGETLTMAGWSRKLEIPWNTLDGRLKKMSFERAITIGKYDSMRKEKYDGSKENQNRQESELFNNS